MALKTWSVTSGSWSVGANWSGSTIPLATDDVTVGTALEAASVTVTLDANEAVSSVLLTGGDVGATLGDFSTAIVTSLVMSASNLTVTNGFTTVGGVVIKGTGSLQVGGVLSGPTLQIQATAGTLIIDVGSINLSGVNSYSNVQVDTLATLIIKATGTSNDLSTLGVNLANTSTLELDGGTFAFLGAAGTITLAGGTLKLGVGGKLATGSQITFTTTGSKIIDATTDGKGLVNTTFKDFIASDTIIVSAANSFKIINATTIDAFASADGSGTAIEHLVFITPEVFSANGTVISGSTLSADSACYLAGTKILTATGEVAVEDLAIGDILITVDAGPQAIRWIGQRAYLARLVNAHHRAGLMPVCISASALADNVPSRDLLVSPEHMMALDGVLVAAHNLLNGSTITRFEDLDVVKYFHIELDQHAVILAEGAASESYLDTGNRNMFTNVLEYAELGMPVGSTVPCLPIVSEGPALAAIRAGIANRAEACGFTTSADADLHLLVDGAPVYPSAINGQSFSFDVAQSASDVRIISRSAVPAEINPASADRRQLGVAMAGLTLRGSGLSIDMLAGEKLLAEGFYPADAGHRWTNGSAPVPAALLALMDGAFSVTVQLVGTDMQYPVAEQGGVVALASARGPRTGAQRLVA